MARQVQRRDGYKGPDTRRPDFLKLLLGAAVGALLALAGWVGSELTNGSRLDAELATSITYLTAQMKELTADMKDLRTQLASGLDKSYRKTDADRDFRPRDARLDQHQKQIDDHEARIRRIEARATGGG